jgi:hypothetical protein
MSEFDPAFEMPTTVQEALAVLKEWGKPSVMTFSSDRARVIYKILKNTTNNRG